MWFIYNLVIQVIYFTGQNIMQKKDPMELNFEGLEMEKWNIATDRAPRVDGKSGVICQVIMFTHGFMAIYYKCQKCKKLVTIWQNI